MPLFELVVADPPLRPCGGWPSLQVLTLAPIWPMLYTWSVAPRALVS